jgi:hypothetical protein
VNFFIYARKSTDEEETPGVPGSPRSARYASSGAPPASLITDRPSAHPRGTPTPGVPRAFCQGSANHVEYPKVQYRLTFHMLTYLASLV